MKFWKKKQIANTEPMPAQINARLNQTIIDYNRAFANNHQILAKMGAALERLERAELSKDMQIRQFAVQVAALVVQREGGDIVALANRIKDYIIGESLQRTPENLIPLIKNVNR